MASLQEDQARIDQKIIETFIDSIPDTWDIALLTAERQQQAAGEKLSITIAGPDRSRDTIAPDDDLYDLLFELLDCFAKHKKLWKRVEYSIVLQQDDDWKYEINFEY